EQPQLRAHERPEDAPRRAPSDALVEEAVGVPVERTGESNRRRRHLDSLSLWGGDRTWARLAERGWAAPHTPSGRTPTVRPGRTWLAATLAQGEGRHTEHHASLMRGSSTP